MPPVVSIKNLSLGFGDITLFDSLNCDVKPGSILAVVGANGSGKSTFVKTLLGLQSPMNG
ncbi:MAG: ATP-binding cassette domain-containing protein, partial [Paracoccaceae bacterium]